MSGGSMDYLYVRVRDATFHINSPERAAFRKHLMLVAKALRSIEWTDSGDGDDQEVHNIMACISQSASENDRLRAEVERLTRERDEARAEIERLREALVRGSEVLASHQGSPQREWHSAGAWLYPGDSINVVRAPLPEIEVVP